MALNCLKRLNKSGIVDKIRFAIYNEYNKRNTESTYRQTSGIQAKGVQTKVHVRIPDFTWFSIRRSQILKQNRKSGRKTIRSEQSVPKYYCRSEVQGRNGKRKDIRKTLFPVGKNQWPNNRPEATIAEAVSDNRSLKAQSQQCFYWNPEQWKPREFKSWQIRTVEVETAEAKSYKEPTQWGLRSEDGKRRNRRRRKGAKRQKFIRKIWRENIFREDCRDQSRSDREEKIGEQIVRHTTEYREKTIRKRGPEIWQWFWKRFQIEVGIDSAERVDTHFIFFITLSIKPCYTVICCTRCRNVTGYRNVGRYRNAFLKESRNLNE